MKTSGFRYALQWHDPIKGWVNRCTGDDRSIIMKMWRDQPNKVAWRVVDQATDAIISEAA